MKQRAEILKDAAIIERKFWRFKKQKNKPVAYLKRLRDKDTPEVESDIERYNTVLDLKVACRNAEVLNAYIAAIESSKPLKLSGFRKSYAFEAWCEALALGRKVNITICHSWQQYRISLA